MTQIQTPSAPAVASHPGARASEADASSRAAAADSAISRPPARSRRRTLLLSAAVVLLAGLGWAGTEYWNTWRFQVSTDNAYVGADIALVSPKVTGYVAAVPVVANSHVKAGDVLVQLDDRDYRVAVRQANAKIGTQDATIVRLGKQVEAGAASIDQARAQVASAEADEARSRADFDRTTRLAENKFASQQALDAARADKDKTHAATLAAQAALESTKANLDVLKAQRLEAERTRVELEAALAKAQLDLDATTLRAPFDGIVGNKAVQVGDYVSAGKRLAALVSDTGAYVDANFKETQIARLEPGQSVELTLDTDPGHPITGTLESIAPAAGQVFSLLPPENATGNFTKVVQRVPVRIRVPDAVMASGVLRPGLSVEARVDTRTTPSAHAKVAAAPGH
ncbi:HlyD family secretion protein [Aquabacter cavernae]|uniref:HlyD family secretion protein n=1 Tax=Aquabacter cavernae TaxID=2496029 RepID=UPI000F8D3D09|nr:HlyD family secretion protein [Aquabacter cavernae]